MLRIATFDTLSLTRPLGELHLLRFSTHLPDRSIGADPVCEVAPVESAGLFDWLWLFGRVGLPVAGGGLAVPSNCTAKRRSWSSRSLSLAAYWSKVSPGGGIVRDRAPLSSWDGVFCLYSTYCFNG